jgi:hypothetical protein
VIKPSRAAQAAAEKEAAETLIAQARLAGLLAPKDFVYIGYGRCGHPNLVACEPHTDDKSERESLVEDLRYWIESGGWVERIHRDNFQAVSLQMCKCHSKVGTTP